MDAELLRDLKALDNGPSSHHRQPRTAVDQRALCLLFPRTDDRFRDKLDSPVMSGPKTSFKRDRAGGSKRSTPTKKRRLQPATEQQLTITEANSLMSLPSELRNHIYAKIAEDATAELVNGTVNDFSEISQVNTAIRREYLSILPQYAGCISIEVVDFDFSLALDFINQCKDAELKTLQLGCPGVPRELEIQLRFETSLTDSFDFRGERHLLERWLKETSDPSKRTAGLNIVYKLSKANRLPAPLGRCMPTSNVSLWRIRAKGLLPKVRERRAARVGLPLFGLRSDEDMLDAMERTLIYMTRALSGWLDRDDYFFPI